MRLILPLPGNEAFAERIAEAGGFELGQLETRHFPDGESYVRLVSDVAGRPVDLVCSLARPDPGFLSLIFAADAARDLGAAEVTLVAPYLAYMRQDRRFTPGEAVTSRAFSRLISSSFDRLVTVDPHLHRYSALAALYDIPARTLHAAPLLADWIAAEVPHPLIIGPDEESEQWVQAVAAAVGAPHVVLRKIRHGDREVEITFPDLTPWQDRRPVLLDDIASSGRTLIEAAHQLQRQGLPPPVCVVVHGIFAGEAFAELSRLSERVVSSDSVPHASNAITLAPLIAAALQTWEADGPTRRRRRPGLAGSSG
ncbi:ribose-phosphate pyrophosphokinase [uncultured Brevundimonas sp.]|jgi:ribose-phosphate pyrophosphokinase|uniref:ribose-phosphate pyrophosphokinase n=1 Tax=uncultured Brevundimonas sp. TaxID=213418 RepID=UPI0030EBEAAC